jgi:hypothetical protein
MFEHFRKPLLQRSAFLKRVLFCMFISTIIFVVTLFTGTAVYHFAGGFSWVDGILNSATLMTGQGIFLPLNSTDLKLFTSFYAIFSTVVFFLILGILFSPLIHRFLHRFHLDDKQK